MSLIGPSTTSGPLGRRRIVTSDMRGLARLKGCERSGRLSEKKDRKFACRWRILSPTAPVSGSIGEGIRLLQPEKHGNSLRIACRTFSVPGGNDNAQGGDPGQRGRFHVTNDADLQGDRPAYGFGRCWGASAGPALAGPALAGPAAGLASLPAAPTFPAARGAIRSTKNTRIGGSSGVLTSGDADGVAGSS
jgi:hypothetical protein